MESKRPKNRVYRDIASISPELISQDKLATHFAAVPSLKSAIEKGFAGVLNPRLLGTPQRIKPGIYNFIQQSTYPFTIYYSMLTGHPGLVKQFQFEEGKIADQLICAGEITVNYDGIIIGVTLQTGNYYIPLNLDNESEAFRKQLLLRSGFREETLFPFNNWSSVKTYQDLFIKNKKFQPTVENEAIESLIKNEADVKLQKFIYALKESHDVIESKKSLTVASSVQAAVQATPLAGSEIVEKKRLSVHLPKIAGFNEAVKAAELLAREVGQVPEPKNNRVRVGSVSIGNHYAGWFRPRSKSVNKVESKPQLNVKFPKIKGNF